MVQYKNVIYVFTLLNLGLMKSTEEDGWRRSRTFTNFLDKFGKRVAFWRLWAEMWPLKAIEGRRATAPWTTTSTATEKLCVTWVYYERRPFFINDIQCRKVIRQIVHWEIVFPLNIIVYSIRKTKGLESLCSFPFQWLNMYFCQQSSKSFLSFFTDFKVWVLQNSSF